MDCLLQSTKMLSNSQIPPQQQKDFSATSSPTALTTFSAFVSILNAGVFLVLLFLLLLFCGAGADAKQLGVPAGGMCHCGECSGSLFWKPGPDAGSRPRPQRLHRWNSAACGAAEKVECRKTLPERLVLSGRPTRWHRRALRVCSHRLWGSIQRENEFCFPWKLRWAAGEKKENEAVTAGRHPEQLRHTILFKVGWGGMGRGVNDKLTQILGGLVRYHDSRGVNQDALPDADAVTRERPSVVTSSV